ncbi:MAG: NADH-quinone oxidoreductase subunit A [Bacteroidetes bacterium]|nr:MAG: NADH-quinone oxidoreductase subunit A [Bacteroidota bacterium]TAE09499.1 MAG: NADH-quinone oxidoreductase subunit A [Bacteroidota bacterium]
MLLLAKEYVPFDYWPIFIQFGLAMAFVIATMIATHLLGPKRNSEIKDETWECGIEPVGDARTPISVKYFLIAILFVLFDVEVIFLYPWAVNFKALGWFGFFEMLLFMALLLFGFYYIIKRDVLKWE